MDWEQRVKALEGELKTVEEDLKLLKNEVQQTLLDIREQLMTGGISPLPQQPAAQGNQGRITREERAEPTVKEKEIALVESPQEGLGALKTLTALGGWLAEKVRKVGTESMIAVLELYGLTNRLPAGSKEIFIQFIRSHKHYESRPLSPQDYVTLFQELDDIIGGKSKAESALLSLLHLGEEAGEG